MKAIRIFTVLGLVCLNSTQMCYGESDEEPPEADAVRKSWSPYLTPLQKADLKSKADPKIVDLGRHLFFERALSSDQTRSCNDCHDLAKYGANGVAAVEAREAGTLKRDVPSLYNLASLNLLCWDAAKPDLRSQTANALTSATENAMPDDDSVVERLKSISHYTERFKAAFADGDRDGEITFERVVDALTTFQQGLVTRAPIDDFLLGDDNALSSEQLKGAVLFDQKNCSACHTGTTIGGQMIQVAGILKPWPNQKDLGHFEVSGNAAHKMGFRVPPLRNVAETAPYFHDYSARSLRRAIRDIALYEQGMFLELEEILLIESFLKSFTGELPTDYIKPPSTGDSAEPAAAE